MWFHLVAENATNFTKQNFKVLYYLPSLKQLKLFCIEPWSEQSLPGEQSQLITSSSWIISFFLLKFLFSLPASPFCAHPSSPDVSTNLHPPMNLALPNFVALFNSQLYFVMYISR
jgi:hypothetical protein